jgi:hypothetical protein
MAKTNDRGSHPYTNATLKLYWLPTIKAAIELSKHDASKESSN